jgi:hypothetical protein
MEGKLRRKEALMRRRFALYGVLVLCLPGFGVAQPAPTAVDAETGETVRQEIVLTNQNLAVINETRRMNLPVGAVSLAWPGVPSSARTETWSLVDARGAGVRWLGLTASPPEEAPLAGLIGKRVRVERPGGGSAEADVVAVSGATPDQVLFREGSDLVYGEPGARLVLPGAGASARPGRVTLKLSSDRAGSRELTSRYLALDLNWEANYALTLSADERTGRLEGWFTIDNRSGTEFDPTRLRLVAGVLRTASAPTPKAAMRAETMVMPQSVAVSEAASESRAYEIASPGRLAQGRTMLPLADNAEVAVEKSYVVRTSYWFGENAESQTLPVAVLYKIGAKKLAAALPAGVVRVYTDGGTVFNGEDRIPHTPERSDFEIEASEAFDLTARRRQSSFTQLGPRESESAWELTLSSRKKEAVTVLVRDSFPGDWTLVESSVPASRKSARVVEFAVGVPAGGEARLTYKVRVRAGR